MVIALMVLALWCAFTQTLNGWRFKRLEKQVETIQDWFTRAHKILEKGSKNND